MAPGYRLSIETPKYQYRGLHDKDRLYIETGPMAAVCRWPMLQILYRERQYCSQSITVLSIISYCVKVFNIYGTVNFVVAMTKRPQLNNHYVDLAASNVPGYPSVFTVIDSAGRRYRLWVCVNSHMTIDVLFLSYEWLSTRILISMQLFMKYCHSEALPPFSTSEEACLPSTLNGSVRWCSFSISASD